VNVDAREIEALIREGEQYRMVGMLDRLVLVNEQIVLRGGVPLDVPAPVSVQRRVSTQAATRTKRKAAG
jgi:hypothetical protein